MKNVKLNLRLSLLVALFTMSFAAPAFAFAGNDNDKVAVELSYVGNLNDKPVYQLNLKNLEAGEYTIVIRDAFGEVLYKEKVKGTSITRKFQLENELTEDNLRFEIVNRNNNVSSVYEINKSSRLVEEVVVNKIK